MSCSTSPRCASPRSPASSGPRARGPDDAGDRGEAHRGEVEQLIVRAEEAGGEDVVAARGDADEVDLGRAGQPLGHRPDLRDLRLDLDDHPELVAELQWIRDRSELD